MASKQNPPGNTGAEQAAAAAMESVLKQAADPVSNATTGKVTWNRLTTPYLTANMNPSGGWLFSPANLACFKSTEDDLNRLGSEVLDGIGEVNKVRACLIDGTKRVCIVPTLDSDLDGIPVNKYSEQVWINLASLLLPAKIRVKAGYRERYNIVRVDNSPVGPALLLDLERRVERRRVNSSSKGKSAKTQETPQSQ